MIILMGHGHYGKELIDMSGGINKSQYFLKNNR